MCRRWIHQIEQPINIATDNRSVADRHAGRTVNHHLVVVGNCPIQKFGQCRHRQQRARVQDTRSTWQDVQSVHVGWSDPFAGQFCDATVRLQDLRQAAVAANFQQARQSGSTHVCVDQQSLLPGLSKGSCKVDGGHRLSFAGICTCDSQAFRLLGCQRDSCFQSAECLGLDCLCKFLKIDFALTQLFLWQSSDDSQNWQSKFVLHVFRSAEAIIHQVQYVDHPHGRHDRKDAVEYQSRIE